MSVYRRGSKVRLNLRSGDYHGAIATVVQDRYPLLLVSVPRVGREPVELWVEADLDEAQPVWDDGDTRRRAKAAPVHHHTHRRSAR